MKRLQAAASAHTAARGLRGWQRVQLACAAAVVGAVVWSGAHFLELLLQASIHAIHFTPAYFAYLAVYYGVRRGLPVGFATAWWRLPWYVVGPVCALLEAALATLRMAGHFHRRGVWLFWTTHLLCAGVCGVVIPLVVARLRRATERAR